MSASLGHAKKLEQGALHQRSTPGNQCAITKVFHHEGTLSDKVVFHFTGNPVCTYIPKEFDEEKIARGEPVHLAFFVPNGTIKHDSKHVINTLNNSECPADYCIKVRSVTTPIKGIRYDITLYPQRRGLEYQSFQSITGERGVVFKFHDQGKLKDINVQEGDNRIRRTAYSSAPSVVLDFGHGGHDHGFTHGHIREKEINRAIGQKVAKLLKKKGYQVCLIREADESLSLDERTAIAHTCKNAGALISIHTNAASRPEAAGIETFCHVPHLFETHYQNTHQNFLAMINDVDTTLFGRSRSLADHVHKNVLESAKTKNGEVIDRKVKHKVAQLLLGSEIPSILVELGFLTNNKESVLLQKDSYQKVLAQGICKGLDAFFNIM